MYHIVNTDIIFDVCSFSWGVLLLIVSTVGSCGADGLLENLLICRVCTHETVRGKMKGNDLELI